jgi:hypothetical protein
MALGLAVRFAIALLAGTPAGPVKPTGTPRPIPWTGTQEAYEISAEAGLSIEVTGPTAVLFELRSKDHGKRVILDIYDGPRYRSRNALKLRLVGGGRGAYRYAALLSVNVEKGTHVFELRAQGAELVALITAQHKFYREFAVRSFDDLELRPPEERLVAAAQENASDGSGGAPVGGTADGGGEGGVDQVAMAARNNDVFATSRQTEIIAAEPGGSPEEQAGVRLALADDTLSIGGRLFAQFVNTTRKKRQPDDHGLSNNNIVDVFLDARPNDTVRGYLAGRLFYNPITDTTALGDSPAIRAALDQLWVKFDLARTVFFTVGQQPIKWGTGRFWNATDFIRSKPRDPLAIVDDRVGLPLLKASVPIESLGWNFIGVANVTNATSPTDVEGALRTEFVYSTAELGLSTAMRRNEPFRVGADLSAGILGIDFRLEGSARHGVKRTFWSGDLDLDSTTLRIPKDYQRIDDWLYQYVVGAEISVPYGSTDVVVVGGEYFYNQLGYENAALYTWLTLVGSLEPLYAGRQYAGAYIMAPAPGTWNDTTVTLSALGNLSDGSWLARLDWRVLAFASLTFQAFATLHLGRCGEFNYGFSIPPQPGSDKLARGLTVEQPVADLGLALLLNY